MIIQPELPFGTSDLEPFLTKEEIDLHYSKHHRAYVDNLNKLIKDTNLEDKSLEDIVKSKAEGPIFNNASQIWNHNFYWKSLTPRDKSSFVSDGDFGKAIVTEFKSFDNFKAKFKDVAVKCFGSGWIWLVVNDTKLEIRTTKNADNFVSTQNIVPLLVCDVWEHSYLYQKEYFADRGAYVDAFLKIANWDFANTNFKLK